MFSNMRRRFTYANVVMTFALVFAITGGAYAAKKYIITSKSQIKPNVWAQLRGPAGANGKDGAAGPQGPQGVQGPAGTSGTDGKDGTSVTSTGFSGSKGTCKEGGSELTAAESKKTFVCNGAPWSAGGNLPKGSTEKGLWATAAPSGLAATGVGFGIPLASAPAVHYINAAGKELTATEEKTSTVCVGTASNPTAPEGTLCVYAKLEKNVNKTAAVNEFFFNGWMWGVVIDANGGEGGPATEPDTAMPVGFDVTALGEGGENVAVNGSWAVTG